MSIKDQTNSNGTFHMNDRIAKPFKVHYAKAEGRFLFDDVAQAQIFDEDASLRADVSTAARVAGIQAAKRTFELFPIHNAHPINWIDVDFEVESNAILIRAQAKAISRDGLEMEVLTAVSVAGLTFFELCNNCDGLSLQDVRILKEEKEKTAVDSLNHPLNIGILVISDRIVAGLSRDDAGQVLKHGFDKAGWNTDNYSIIENDTDKLVDQVQAWLEAGIDLIITTGGNGIGQRDITLKSLEPFFDFRLEGVEQALYNLAQINNNGLYCDRIAAGKIGKTIVISLPLDQQLANDAMEILIPNIYQAFEI